jgi:hypothetical protein
VTDKAVCDELEVVGRERTRDQECAALTRELAQVTKERDFLRDAAASFAKRSKCGAPVSIAAAVAMRCA